MVCTFCGEPFGSELRVANWAYVHSKVMLHLLSECHSRPQRCDETDLRRIADEIADSLTEQTSYPLEDRPADDPAPASDPTRR
jgi:hypothetical protein